MDPIEHTARVDGVEYHFTWPADRTLLDALLDGAPGDPARTDRQTEAARAAEVHLRELVDAGTVSTSRLPLGAGMTVITRR